MGSYIENSNTIKFSSIKNKDFSLSSQQYKKVLLDNAYTKTVRELLVTDPQSGKEVGSDAYVEKSDYLYIRTKGFGKYLFNIDLSIADSFSYIKPKSFKANCGKHEIRCAKKGDILFATGGDVGNACYVDEDLGKNIISSHILKLNFGDLQHYCLAVLNTDLIKDQASLAPSGGIKGLDTFSMDYLLDAKIPLPKYDYDQTVEYISKLSEANTKIERRLFKKIEEINSIILDELTNNQKKNDYSYSLPRISEIFNIGRLDTLRYSQKHKDFSSIIKNYKNGWSNLSDLGYLYERGQNLQISNIGLSIYSDIPKANFYSLIFSKNFTKYCTYTCETYLGNKLKLNELQKGDIVFSSRGDYGRCVIVLDELQKTITNIDNIVITSDSENVNKDIFICMVMNLYRENGFIRTIGFVGSGADSLTQAQIDSIPFPIFEQGKMDEIAYHFTNRNINPEDISFDNIQKALEIGGVKELDDLRKNIRAKLNEAIKNIANGERVVF